MKKATGIMLISVFKTLSKETFLIKPKDLLELTSSEIFFKYFPNTLRKRKIKGGLSGLRQFLATETL